MTSDAQILAPPAAAGEGADPRRWLTLIILLLAAFMNLLDVSIVNIAIPSIQRDLNASYADVQWALAGYTLAYALVLITGGRLGDTFGRKRLFLIGVSGFTIMSALCGAALTRTTPTGSSFGGRGDRDSRTSTAAAITAMMPTGTLIRKMGRQVRPNRLC